ncbi:MAG: hypothetical protein NC407_09795 [Lachnoclostridium sp.]|nr:hypothetical protein [Lachnoclostridium sp.]
MRNFQKQQLLDIITSIHLLHQEIRGKLEQKDYPTVQTGLADCQEAAIQMGEAIEQLVGTGTEAVGHLEQYCEKIYQINEELESIPAKKAYKAVEGILIKAENAINHMPVRKEVVFLPYKASMWDSLESVWKAADEDPGCDAYVIPIPYLDKNPDGSFREVHYEGDLYPSYVPVTKYDEFDFGEHRPDMIFIHNPYDAGNFVTSVHPFFYSDNLKQYTDKLIYIPYFVLDEIEPDNKEAVEGIKHFCTVPGVFNADKVIVQSEKMRQIYINVLTKELGEGTRSIWEGKILGLGSPKYDKVASAGKEDFEIPDEWRKIITKPDGSWKKIIFYNTSINALLHHNEDMIKKIQYVFGVFKDHQDEVALLWRPHPLIQATVSSMRPMLWVEYEKLLMQYKEEGWGIYDDTADLNRAIELSDAYYGDESSVVQLYQKTGKPVMMQKVEIL